jgi:hypothetical protein|tara:strand:- start:2939 stop:3052 length:114 start_codon:yes stop_codon:yes gene_type:complete
MDKPAAAEDGSIIQLKAVKIIIEPMIPGIILAHIFFP